MSFTIQLSLSISRLHYFPKGTTKGSNQKNLTSQWQIEWLRDNNNGPFRICRQVSTVKP